MNDPLLGYVSNNTGSLQVRDIPESPADEPRVSLSLEAGCIELNQAELAKAIFTLRQAQELLINRKAQAFLEKNLSLF